MKAEELIAIKDKLVILGLLYPLFFLLEGAFKLMHWTAQARLKSSLGVQYGQSSRKIHWSNTGQDPFEEAKDAALQQQYRKSNRLKRRKPWM